MRREAKATTPFSQQFVSGKGAAKLTQKQDKQQQQQQWSKPLQQVWQPGSASASLVAATDAAPDTIAITAAKSSPCRDVSKGSSDNKSQSSSSRVGSSSSSGSSSSLSSNWRSCHNSTSIWKREDATMEIHLTEKGVGTGEGSRPQVRQEGEESWAE